MISRTQGTSTYGSSFDNWTVDQVWQKATPIPGLDANEYRRDSCGAFIARGLYGHTASVYGWEVDHIVPVSRGGRDDLSNLQPLQWQNNRAKSDSTYWSCVVTR